MQDTQSSTVSLYHVNEVTIPGALTDVSRYTCSYDVESASRRFCKKTRIVDESVPFAA